MTEMTVGVRELKAHLGRYLKIVKEGGTVTITDRGRTVGEIRPTGKKHLWSVSVPWRRPASCPGVDLTRASTSRWCRCAAKGRLPTWWWRTGSDSLLRRQCPGEAFRARSGAVFANATIKATGMASGAEVPAAFALGVKVSRLTPQEGQAALAEFWQQWPDLVKIPFGELAAKQAGDLAWRLRLRGYDAVHLASALLASTMAGGAVAVVTFDQQLWQAAQSQGLPVIPQDLSPYLIRPHQ